VGGRGAAGAGAVARLIYAEALGLTFFPILLPSEARGWRTVRGFVVVLTFCFCLFFWLP
jgi:hypothetical protein